MPLNSASLTQALLDLGDPGSAAEAGQAWAQAVGQYASEVVPPSTTVSAATTTLAGALAAAFATPAAAPLMEVAFLAFGVSVGLGMAPTFIAVPPVAPVGFVAFMATMRDSREVAMQELAGLIDTWMKTGTATLAVPPNTPVTWT
jgi:hypothetical protein